MNSTFDTGRFGKYLSYDLTRAWQNAGLTVLINACMPIFTFVIAEMFALVFSHHLVTIPTWAIIIAYFVSFTIVVLSFPVRQYGGLTDREAGSNWILLPASQLEKFLSMIIVTCLVVPAVWFAVIAASDGLLCLLFPNLCEGMALKAAIGGIAEIYSELGGEGFKIFIGPVPALWLSWCANILFFTLSSIFFRKYKIVYGFLVLMGLSMAISMASVAILGSNIIDGDLVIGPDCSTLTPEIVSHWFNVIMAALYVVEFTILLGCIWLRIKTIKH
ncbi:MAG: hypothetical protein J5771_05725 [Bacteroidales bacterium]|nr:hypothetical protein [Bacteroidales bacterium]